MEENDAPVDVCGVRLTHPSRTVYVIEGRAFTKLDVARYVEKAAPRMLPHVRGRPVTIVRARGGSTGPAFFQKHVMKGMPSSIHALEVVDRSGPTQCLTVHDAAGLVGLVQMSALEFHVWGASEHDHETPDRLVFDLDPGDDVTWQDVVAAARHARAVLEGDGLTSFVKTTGGKGLHVVTPLDPKKRASWFDVGAYSERCAQRMIEERPEKYTGNMKKAVRKGRIFLDFARNTRGATAVVPWSTRVKGATISMPVVWEELDDVRGSTWTLANVEARLHATDAWAGFFDLQQTIPV